MATSTLVIEPRRPMADRKGDPKDRHDGERVGNHRPECHFAQVAVAIRGSTVQAGMEGQAIERDRLDEACSINVAAVRNAFPQSARSDETRQTKALSPALET
jgi:hypothetical protein